MENFQSLGLPQSLLQSLERLNFITPTPIQVQAIPHALEGRDVLGSAQTGTGKTGAFGIPLVNHLLNSSTTSALVLVPTRELAVQVLDTLHKFLGKTGNIKTVLLIGGASMTKQFQQLKYKPRLIVATPGRINDHLARGSLILNNVNFFVLDEIDRMLDMGFGIQLEKIVQYLPPQRQTLMFSATLPKHMVAMSQKYLNNPVRVSVGSTHMPINTIKQEVIQVSEADKYNQLLNQINQREGSIIVFVKTKMGADKLADKLCSHDHSADAIHGDLSQNKRDMVIKAFRNRKHRIMVATDVAARGLDIPHIEHVINYDLPQCPEDYIHRIGRTARGSDGKGSAVNLITNADNVKWRAINKLLTTGESTEIKYENKKRPSFSHKGRSNNGNNDIRNNSKAPFRFKPARRKPQYSAA